MIPNPPKDPEEPLPQPTKPKRSRKKTVEGQSVQVKQAGNAIGIINADGQAVIKIDQRSIYTQSENENQHQAEESELKKLETAIKQIRLDLEYLVQLPLPVKGNPFLLMEAFDLHDSARFFGREEALAQVLEFLVENHTTFLEGSGRTSLLQAAVIPALLRQGHLPILVFTTTERLELSIKKRFLPNIEKMDYLRQMSLPEFIRKVTGLLKGKNLYLLVDQFEEIDHQDETFRDSFQADWAACVNGNAPNAHWLFAVPNGLKHPLRIFQDHVTINAKLVTLHPMEPDEARRAIQGQAALRDIQIDGQVISAILTDLGKPAIEPAQLELVGYVLAGKKGEIVKNWSLEYYLQKGRADGILNSYLLDSINELDEAEREPAWNILATLDDLPNGASSEADLLKRTHDIGIEGKDAEAALKDLREKHLVEYAAAYKLSSKSLHPQIEEWRNQRAALEQAREEIWKQIRGLGGSALRGLAGGSIGFMLSYVILPYPVRNFDPGFVLSIVGYGLFVALRGLIGAGAGFLMVLGLDISRAALKGKRNHLVWSGGALSGAIAFALALISHFLLITRGGEQAILLGILSAGALGLVWGAMAGLGTIWALDSAHTRWLKLFASAAACGLVFAAAESLLGALQLQTSLFLLFLSGAFLPLFVTGFAMLGKPSDPKWR